MFKYWHPTPWALHIPAFELGSRILQLFQIKNILGKGRKQHLNLAKKSNFPGKQKNRFFPFQKWDFGSPMKFRTGRPVRSMIYVLVQDSGKVSAWFRCGLNTARRAEQ